jgi:hypothetical protein
MKSVADFSFHPVSGAILPEIGNEVVKIWTELAGLNPEEAHRRLSELTLVVKNVSGKIAGISTASKVLVERLNNNWFYQFRYFLTPDFRFAGLDFKLIQESVKHLETISHTEDHKFVGISVIVQNQKLKQLYGSRRTVLRNVPFVFAGFSSKGHVIRIYYFKDARI